MPEPKRKRGRQQLELQRRKGIAMRMAECILERFRTLGAFTRKVVGTGKVSKNAVGKWLPDWRLVIAELNGGAPVPDSQWDNVHSPELPGLIVVSEVLDVSVDYLLGYPVRKRRSDRHLVTPDIDTGQLAAAMVQELFGELGKRDRDWEIVATYLCGRVLQNPAVESNDQIPPGSTAIRLVNEQVQIDVSDPMLFLNGIRQSQDILVTRRELRALQELKRRRRMIPREAAKAINKILRDRRRARNT